MKTDSARIGRRLLRSTVRSVGHIFRRHWGWLLTIAAVGLATGAVATGFAELVSQVVNLAENHLGDDRPVAELFFAATDRTDRSSLVAGWVLEIVQTLGGLLVAAILLALVIANMSAAATSAKAVIGAAIYKQLRHDAFERCFNQARAVDVALTEDGVEMTDGTVSLASSINRGADAVSSTYSYLLSCVQQAFVLASALITSGADMLPVTAVCLAIVAAQVWLAQGLARKLRDSRRELDASTNRLQSRTAELLSAREVLLAFDKSDRYKERLRELVGSVGDLQAGTERTEGHYRAAQSLIENWGQIAIIGAAVALIVLAVMPEEISQGERSASPLVFAMALYGTLLSPARQLISGYDSMRRSEAVVASFLSIFGVDAGLGVRGKSEGWTAGAPISLEDISYTPPGRNEPLYSNFSVTIPARTTTLILGPSGCGKTTLGRLCLGFLEPDSGTVQIGGGPLATWSDRYLHKAISYMPQVDQILHGTVADNLRLAEDDHPLGDAELERVLDMVKLKCGHSGRLELDAKDLSGGEMQRLSAARILLDRAEILLLDEPMAGVDVFTMADIAPAIEAHWRKTAQTVLLISHKLVFATLASHVIILDESGVAEQGSPEDLVARGGIYSKLRAEALRQAGGGIADNKPSSAFSRPGST